MDFPRADALVARKIRLKKAPKELSVRSWAPFGPSSGARTRWKILPSRNIPMHTGSPTEEAGVIFADQETNLEIPDPIRPFLKKIVASS
jgi:hypothetical protein